MRMKKSMAKSLAAYYDSVEPKRVPVDPTLEAMTDYLPAVRSSENVTSRERRKNAIRSLLLADDNNKEDNIGKDILQDISFEASPQETEIVLKEDGGERWFTLLKKDATPADPASVTEVERTVREQRDASEASDESFRRRLNASATTTSSTPRLVRIPVRHITNSALKKYRGLDALAKSVSWNDDNLQDLEMQKSKSGGLGLKKSVSWKEDVVVTSPASKPPLDRKTKTKTIKAVSQPLASPSPRPSPSSLRPEPKQSVSDVLGVLRSMRTMSLAESYSLADDDTHFLEELSRASASAAASSNQRSKKAFAAGKTNSTVASEAGQATGRRRSLWRRVGHVVKPSKTQSIKPPRPHHSAKHVPDQRKAQNSPVMSHNALHQQPGEAKRSAAIPISRGQRTYASSSCAAREARPYSVFLPREGSQTGWEEQSETAYSTVEEELERQIIRPPSVMASYDDSDRVRRAGNHPSFNAMRVDTRMHRQVDLPESHTRTKTPSHTDMDDVTVSAPIGNAIRHTNATAVHGSLQREAMEIGHDMRDLTDSVINGITNDMDVCTRGRYDKVRRSARAPVKDALAQSSHDDGSWSEGESGHPSGSDILSGTDSSSHILSSNSSLSASDASISDADHSQGRSVTKEFIAMHQSISDLEDGSSVSTFDASHDGRRSTESEIASESLLLQKATASGWFW